MSRSRAKGNNRAIDILATLTAFSAHCVHRAYGEFVLPRAQPTEIIVSGGGVHNLTLMTHLRRLFARIPVMPLEEVGFDSDAKEAVLFAVLANESLQGVPNNLPGATGARWPVVLGKFSP